MECNPIEKTLKHYVISYKSQDTKLESEEVLGCMFENVVVDGKVYRMVVSMCYPDSKMQLIEFSKTKIH